MMPDLGKYAVEVALAYGVSITLIAVILVLSVLRSRRVQRQLKEIEGRRHG